MRDNWAPVIGLVLFAVALTTAAVAVVTRALIPEVPWAVAIALGAVVAPPDAVAATAVLRQVQPPHRILTILESESLFNDATALLIYRLTVGATVAGGRSWKCAPATRLVTMHSTQSRNSWTGSKQRSIASENNSLNVSPLTDARLQTWRNLRSDAPPDRQMMAHHATA